MIDLNLLKPPISINPYQQYCSCFASIPYDIPWLHMTFTI
uniref:Uncharacterized protein n=1 Tax=Nelumbo nucifera TaxID=4432 RepID=A0A822Z4D4_NELNU|nr:TPA_asm: hypothetical protein HUJ06_013823 [Nelumbo nucifera]